MKILFIKGFDEEMNTPTVACTNEVIAALCKVPGVEVKITGGVLNGEQAHVNWKRHPVFMVRKIIHWPAIDPDAVVECYDQICRELEKTHYDAMIAMHMPYDAVLAAVHAKKKFPDVKLMLYELDPMIYEIDRHRKSIGKYLYFMRVWAERRTYNICDTILQMESTKEKFNNKKYSKYSKKIMFLDFPLVHDRGLHEQSAKEYRGQPIRLIYAGRLMSQYRSPEYLLKVLTLVHEKVNIEVMFYSNGNCEDMLGEYSKKYSFIHQMGHVAREDLEIRMRECDCLINIGNQMSDMLPSKLISYIETGMPIVHLQKQENDACVEYLDKYKLSVMINEKDPVEASAENLSVFLQRNYGRRLSSDFIVSQFPHNLPEYSAKKIVEII